jgi:hypothetical protein
MNRQYNTRAIYDICVKQDIIDKNEISYRDFFNVIREFHKEISSKIIFDTYRFKPSEIGVFEIIKDIRRGKSIDWNASKKRKQQLLDDGLVPFSKAEAPDGIKWFVYHEGSDYFKWNWFKDTGAKFIKNIKYYTFKVTTGNRRTVAPAVKQNPFADLDYGIRR